MRRQSWSLTGLQALLVALVISHGAAFPNGAPEDACVDMQPGTQVGVAGEEGHTADPQNELPTYGNTKRPPYYMLIHQSGTPMYNSGESITISIVANQTTGMVMYKGILLEMRQVICASDLGMENETVRVYDPPIGTFSLPGASSDTLLQTLTCNGVADAAVTHKSPQFKINQTVVWTAPSSNVGNLILRATIVQESYIYWTEVYSKVFLDASGGSPAECDACHYQGHVGLIISLLIGRLFLLGRSA